MLRSQRLKSSCTVAHNCHGKRNNLAAKEKDSRQKKKTHGKRKNFTAKMKRLTAKEKTLQQRKKPHGIKKRLTAREKTTRQKEKTDGKRNNLTANEISMSSRHKRERIGAGRFFLLPWVFSFSPWGSSFYGGPCNVSRQKQNLQQGISLPPWHFISVVASRFRREKLPLSCRELALSCREFAWSCCNFCFCRYTYGPPHPFAVSFSFAARLFLLLTPRQLWATVELSVI